MRRIVIHGLWLLLLGGCSLIPDREATTLQRYTLELSQPVAAESARGRASVLIPQPGSRGELATEGMAYRSADHRFGYFVQSRWADRPDEMLHALLIETLSQRGPFDRLVRPGTPVNADYRLNLEVLDFSQDFTVEPSQYRVRVRLQLIELDSRRIVVEELLSVSLPSPSDDARGGAQAANQAVNRLLDEIVVLLTDALMHDG